MPQVHNRDLARGVDSSAFSKSSRFMSVNQSSAETTKRLYAKYKVEKKFREHHLAIAERHKKNQTAHIDRIVSELNESLKRTLAYKHVIAKKRFSNIDNKDERLNTNYTMYAMRFDIADQLKEIDPATIREKKARKKVDVSTKQYNKVIARNLRTILSPRTRYRKQLRKQLQLEAEETFLSTVTTPPKPMSRLSTQKSMGLVVTKSFILDKKNKNRLDSTKEEKPDSTLKLPPIKAAINNTEGSSRSNKKISREPLPGITPSPTVTKSMKGDKTPVFKSQKPTLPAIKVT